MANNSELTKTPPATAQELAEIIAEFEEYRERLINETMTTAQRAKMSKKAVLAKLEPELSQIDTVLVQLKEQQATLNAEN